jgi:glycosyltransferase involved in cell wall biosynthesis
MPILEANTVGRPVVTSSAASMPETAGDAAALVDPSDVESIRAAFERVFNDEAYRSQLVEAGFANAKRFGPAASADAFAAIYERLGTGGKTNS